MLPPLQGRRLKEQQELAAAVIQRCYRKYKQVGLCRGGGEGPSLAPASLLGGPLPHTRKHPPTNLLSLSVLQAHLDCPEGNAGKWGPKATPGEGRGRRVGLEELL